MSEKISRSVFAQAFFPGPSTDHKQLPSSGRAGRNLPAAVTTAIILIAVFLGSLLFCHPIFIALIIVMALCGIWEIAGACARVDLQVLTIPVYLGTIAIFLSAYLGGASAILFAIVGTFFLTALVGLFSTRGKSQLTRIAISLFAIVYIDVFGAFVFLILRAPGSAWALALYVLITIANDIGGWAVGILCGSHPMLPRVSPKKSWEGFAGSLVACLLVGIGIMAYLKASLWWGIPLGLGTAIAATAGDFTESMIKREVGLKDMSNLLPGHGGILDRVDSLLMTAPFFYCVMVVAL